MEEVEGTISDGDRVVVPGTTVLLDIIDASAGSNDAGWHAHVALPLGMVIEPGVVMRLETTDGRSGLMSVLASPTVEGDRVLHVFTGTGPLTSSSA
ncbi:MAG TPA: hypothetical protein VIK85_01025 [Coriobacteriia bacterium]